MSSASSTVVCPTFRFPHLPSPANSTGHQQGRRHLPPPSSLSKAYETTLAREAALYLGGLRTPPAEDTMSTAYHNHHTAALSSTYDNHVSLARNPSALSQVRTGGVLCDAAVNQISRSQHPQQPHGQQYQHQSQYQPQPIHHATNFAPISSHPHSASSRHSTQPSTPASTMSSQAHSEGTVSRRDSTLVTHSLELPSFISPNGGNLDDFAALMTCFFWFENMETIQAAEGIKTRRSSSPIPPLSSFTRPCTAYRKWVSSILTTTQVTQNVILLALLFVYRLKSTNPKVNGSPGSEYRLLTVALMLGNKFLDDNTYTNKTWAEVSGITVKEIHVMEVEFLSNMRYGLLTSREQWEDWQKKLACFHEYCERAEQTERAMQMAAQRAQTPGLSLSIPTPTHRGFTSPLLSPTTVLPSSTHTSPPSATAYSPQSAITHPYQAWHGVPQSTPALSPLAGKPSLGFHSSNRKRSLEGSELAEPAPKRVNTRQNPAPSSSSLGPSGPSEHVRLPVPQLALDTSQAPTPQVAYPSSSNYSQPAMPLPPLGGNVRAMSTVYPHATTWASQAPIMATCGPQTPSYAAPSNFGTPTKRHSPGRLVAYGSSPMTEPFAIRTPISNSPSVYLQQRNSPYKPVKPVATLNYPPPSIPLSEYHLGSAQMHYQPLGRRNVHTGIIPEFLHSGYGNDRLTPVPTTQTPGHHYPA